MSISATSKSWQAREISIPGAFEIDSSEAAESEDSEASTIVCDVTANDDALCTVSPVALPLSDFMSTKENIANAANSLASAFDSLHVATPTTCLKSRKTKAEGCDDKRRIEFNIPSTPTVTCRDSCKEVPKSLYKTPFERNPRCSGSSSGEEEDDESLFHTAIAHKTRRRVISSDDEEKTDMAEVVKPKTTLIDLSNTTDSSSSDDDSPALWRRLQTPFKKEVFSVAKIRKQVQDMKMKTEVVDIDDGSDNDSSFIVSDDEDFLSVGSSTKKATKYVTKVEDICQDSELLDESNRDPLVRELLQLFNRAVFNNALPCDLGVKWNMRLTKTAGVTYTSVKAGERVCRIELSTKVVDSFYRLKTTLLHECCHVAAWLVQGSNKPPHGPAFKFWAQKGHLVGVEVTTRHTYAVHAKYRYECTVCKASYGRHSKSIDVNKKVCGGCRGKLQYVGAFNRDGTEFKSRRTRKKI